MVTLNDESCLTLLISARDLRAYILFFSSNDRALMIEDVPPVGGTLPDRGAAGSALTLA